MYHKWGTKSNCPEMRVLLCLTNCLDLEDEVFVFYDPLKFRASSCIEQPSSLVNALPE